MNLPLAQGDRFARAGLAVRELRSPFTTSIASAAHARVQFSAPLHGPDLADLAAYVRENPAVELRLHGGAPFNAALIERFAGLRRLVLDVETISFDALAAVADSLEYLAVGRRVRGPFRAPALPHLRELELHGSAIDAAAVARLPALRSLVLSGGTPESLTAITGVPLRSLAIRFGAFAEVTSVAVQERLQHLELRGLPSLRSIPPMRGLAALRSLTLAGLPLVGDVLEVLEAPALERLEIDGMPHLLVFDLYCLRQLKTLSSVAIDIGGRRKNREVYRALELEDGPSATRQRSPRLPG
ncbi:MAG: hypothetical protein M3R35_06645 [Candidatus Eremiobacteraeota bacterium]|nr:hypothetical protein [Candidatus Eremiobacteraeota bacterium]